MLIPCPVCGLRDHEEFTYGGDATVARPDVSDGDPSHWAAYVYDRTNPRGPHEEYWHHVHGCRQWLLVMRNTETHAVGGARLVGAWANRPEASGETR
ncbi:MAG TPA: sarcosine oxidase subunit delta [Propylenella sp.]